MRQNFKNYFYLTLTSVKFAFLWNTDKLIIYTIETFVTNNNNFQKEKTHIKSKYAQNPKSMLQYEYESVYFVCRKPDTSNNNTSSS